MKIIFSTEDFVYRNKAISNMPIFLDSDLSIAEPFQSFLVDKFLNKGSFISPKSWETYARRLWDFYMFISTNGIIWNDESQCAKIISTYREWSINSNIAFKTINLRIGIVVEFYKWAKENDLIKFIPYGYVNRRINDRNDFLSHARSTSYTANAIDVFMPIWRQPVSFLTLNQLRLLSEFKLKPEWRLLIDLIAKTGLRSCEARTFPIKYVFNPLTRNDLNHRSMIRIKIDPRDMDIKYSKQRYVDIPFNLMSDLYSYLIYMRSMRENGNDNKCLILSKSGHAFTKDSVSEVFREVSRKIGFKVTALKLRHTYAINTLLKLRSSKKFIGDPLLYVKDRLGHSDVRTTYIYLNEIDFYIDGLDVLIDEELDGIFK